MYLAADWMLSGSGGSEMIGHLNHVSPGGGTGILRSHSFTSAGQRGSGVFLWLHSDLVFVRAGHPDGGLTVSHSITVAECLL